MLLSKSCVCAIHTRKTRHWKDKGFYCSGFFPATFSLKSCPIPTPILETPDLVCREMQQLSFLLSGPCTPTIQFTKRRTARNPSEKIPSDMHAGYVLRETNSCLPWPSAKPWDKNIRLLGLSTGITRPANKEHSGKGVIQIRSLFIQFMF